MTDITFVRTRTEYPPYDDYYRLAELSGYPLCYVDEINPADASKCYIVSPLNGEWQHGWPGARATIYFNQMEWHTDHSRVQLPPGVDYAWSADRWHAQLIGAKFVPLGSHECLNPDPAATMPKRYDVAFMAYTDVYRRKRIKDLLEEAGLSIAPNGWGNERHETLLQSRMIVHTHQWENIPTIAPLRWCLAAAYRLPIISEDVNNRAPFAGHHFMSYSYGELVEKVTFYAQPEMASSLYEYGQALHQFLCHEMTFRNVIERAV